MAVLEKLGVRTIGDFCALSEADIQGLDFHLPQHETIKQFLERHFAKKLAERSDPKIFHTNIDSQDVYEEKTHDDEMMLDSTITSSDELRIDELVQSSTDSKREESSKSPDPTPNGQIISIFCNGIFLYSIPY